MKDSPNYFKYWGKADRDDPVNKYHRLPYHCLDVAAVASLWWKMRFYKRNLWFMSNYYMAYSKVNALHS